jgi:hypothetical protein
MGDGISALAFDRTAAHQPSFAADINGVSSSFFPAMIDGGVASERSADGAGHVTDYLNLNPDIRYFCIGYGSYDAALSVATDTFRANMQAIIDAVKAAGKIPILARIPYSPNTGALANVPMYNAVIDSLATSNQLRAGPDLYSYFMAHPTEMMVDGIRPNDTGQLSVNQLWATSVRALYP